MKSRLEICSERTSGVLGFFFESGLTFQEERVICSLSEVEGIICLKKSIRVIWTKFDTK